MQTSCSGINTKKGAESFQFPKLQKKDFDMPACPPEIVKQFTERGCKYFMRNDYRVQENIC